MVKIVLIGGGGHAQVMLDVIMSAGQYEPVGIVDPGLKAGEELFGVEVLGGDDLLPELKGRGIDNVCIGVGSVRDCYVREGLYVLACKHGLSVPKLLHPSALVATWVELAEGVQINAGAVLQPGSSVGENSIINTGAIVEHGCLIGAHVHVSTGAVLAGGCVVEEGAFIGANATVLQGVTIAKRSVVGAGAVVVCNVPAGTVVKGVPAK